MAKTALMKKWSEKIMYACYHLLMNLAEDLSVEKKMLKRQLLENMVTHLRNAHSLQLLTVILGFLKKLSGFEENKTALVEDLDTIPVLVRLLSAELAPQSLLLLFVVVVDLGRDSRTPVRGKKTTRTAPAVKSPPEKRQLVDQLVLSVLMPSTTSALTPRRATRWSRYARAPPSLPPSLPPPSSLPACLPVCLQCLPACLPACASHYRHATSYRYYRFRPFSFLAPGPSLPLRHVRGDASIDDPPARHHCRAPWTIHTIHLPRSWMHHRPSYRGSSICSCGAAPARPAAPLPPQRRRANPQAVHVQGNPIVMQMMINFPVTTSEKNSSR